MHCCGHSVEGRTCIPHKVHLKAKVVTLVKCSVPRVLAHVEMPVIGKVSFR